MDRLDFGIFHTTMERNSKAFYKIMACDYVNTIIVECDYKSQDFEKTFEELLKHEDKSAWISVTNLGFKTISNTSIADTGTNTSAFNPTTIVQKDYTERIDNLILFLKEKGWYKKVKGFYMDEPLLWNITNDDLEAFTGYFRTVAAPDKRFFICFSVAAVAPEFWTINNIKPITPKSVQYLTDIAFDMYHAWSEDYEKITELMLKRAGDRKDLFVWFIPCTMDYRGNKTEQHCIDHLNGCFSLLKKSQNPGGLMCFTYHTFSPQEEDLGNVGLDKLTDPTYKKYWPILENKIVEIGRSLINGKYNLP